MILRGTVQSQVGYGGVTHRPAGGGGKAKDVAAALWLSVEGSPSKEQPKRSRVNGKLMVMVMALALAVLFSFAIFNSGSRFIAGWQYQSPPAAGTATPGKWHRKLERDPPLKKDQLSSEAAEEEAEDAVAAQLDPQEAGADVGGKEQAAASARGGASDGAMAAEKADAGQQAELEKQGQEGQQQKWGGSKGAGDAGDYVKEAEGEADASEEDEYEEEQAPDAQVRKATRRKMSPYQRALQNCRTLACLHEAASEQKRYPDQFLFPHFLILGWQKCATTSLFHHLKDHPNVLMPIEKEPEFFSYECNYDAESCPEDRQWEYIEETLHLNRALWHNLGSAMFEGSTHYAREGHRLAPSGKTFAKSLFEVFPWVKLLASMREPISRYLSMLGHNLDKNTYTCLNKHDSLFECLELELPWNNYSSPIQAWLDAFPREQVLLLQYESLTAPEREAEHLKAVKSFLGIDPELPANQLGHNNTRADRLGREPGGWPMKKWQYQRLIEVVRPDVDRLAAILSMYGMSNMQSWVHEWEKAWQANLDACSADGECSIE